MRFIILEGPDGSGKTTLARSLNERGYKYIRNGPPTEEEERDPLGWWIRQLLAVGDEKVVFDRLHLSHLIYGSTMRGQCESNETHELLLERYINAIGGQVVLCLPPWRIVFKNWLDNIPAEYVQSPDKLRIIYELYLELLYKRRPYLWFDYTRQRLKQFTSSLIVAENYMLREGYVGSPAARFVFVGERCTDETKLPFMSMKGSAGYLHECIMAAGYEEHEIAFTNAVSPTGYTTNLGDMKASYIALGNVARQALNDQLVSCTTIEHPRYQHESDNDYIEKLRKIRRETK